ncbi:GDP-mannose 4,6-dehydratase [Candidatus Bathyarchaeota archaeon]|nr:GDP-mannose 4,6-dehydratase [Candidatus Bathyarchaeota archaeon]
MNHLFFRDMDHSSSRVLVTGGAGFIGSHLVDGLLRDGWEVTVLDDFSSGRLENLRGGLDGEALRVVRGDVREASAVRKALEEVGVVLHLAAVTSVPYSVEHPDETYQVNVEGTRNLLEECLRGTAERVIYISTCAVYGEPEYLPIDEDHPTRPASPYAESKLEAERLCMEFQESYGLRTTVLRLFNVYGSRMRADRYGGVISTFMRQLWEGGPLTIYGDGEQTRDFIHVSDAVRAMMLTLTRDDISGETFNIATGVPTSINRLAAMISELRGVEPRPIHLEARAGEPRHSYGDIRRAKERLGFTPRVSLREGLQLLLEAAEDRVGFRWGEAV